MGWLKQGVQPQTDQPHIALSIGEPPARATVQVARLPKDARIEIALVAGQLEQEGARSTELVEHGVERREPRAERAQLDVVARGLAHAALEAGKKPFDSVKAAVEAVYKSRKPEDAALEHEGEGGGGGGYERSSGGGGGCGGCGG